MALCSYCSESADDSERHSNPLINLAVVTNLSSATRWRRLSQIKFKDATGGGRGAIICVITVNHVVVLVRLVYRLNAQIGLMACMLLVLTLGPTDSIWNLSMIDDLKNCKLGF